MLVGAARFFILLCFFSNPPPHACLHFFRRTSQTPFCTTAGPPRLDSPRSQRSSPRQPTAAARPPVRLRTQLRRRDTAPGTMMLMMMTMMMRAPLTGLLVCCLWGLRGWGTGGVLSGGGDVYVCISDPVVFAIFMGRSRMYSASECLRQTIHPLTKSSRRRPTQPPHPPLPITSHHRAQQSRHGWRDPKSCLR